jgi:hypothetical protein
MVLAIFITTLQFQNTQHTAISLMLKMVLGLELKAIYSLSQKDPKIKQWQALAHLGQEAAFFLQKMHLQIALASVLETPCFPVVSPHLKHLLATINSFSLLTPNPEASKTSATSLWTPSREEETLI